jgi:hypothetical protein
VLAALQGLAQYNYGKYNYYTIGGRLTYDVYNFTEKNEVNAEMEVKPGFSFGVSGGYYATYLMELHAGFRYSFHDLNIDWLLPPNANPLAVKRSEYKLRYISMPMQVRINVIYQRHVKFNLGAGLMPEFRLKPRETVTFVSNETMLTEDIHTTKEFRKVLVAAPLSAHMKINIDRHSAFELSGSYYYYLGKLMPNIMEKNGTAYSFTLAFMYDW